MSNARIAHFLQNQHLPGEIHILSLPNEIIIKIIEFVDEERTRQYSGAYPSPLFAGIYYPLHYETPTSELKSLKSLRLVCGRFYTLSSPSFLPILTIQTTPKSIKHLEEVSLHPLISGGVRFINLKTYLPYPDFLMPFQLFKDGCENAFKTVEVNLEREIKAKRKQQAPAGTAFQSHHTEIARLRSVLQETKDAIEAIKHWKYGEFKTADEFPDAGKRTNTHHTLQVEIRDVLDLAYAKYRRDIVGYQASLEDGTTASLVATAMDRMPLAQRLCLTDEESCGMGSERRNPALWAPLHMVTAVDKDELAMSLIDQVVETYYAAAVPHERVVQAASDLHLTLVQQLPPALVTAGCALKKLEVYVLHPRLMFQDIQAGLPAMTPEQVQQLRVACQQLTALTICDGHFNIHNGMDATRFRLRDFASVCMGSTHLKYLNLQGLRQTSYMVRNTPYGLTLSNIPVSSITTLRLDKFSTTLSVLRKFLIRLPRKISMVFDTILLLCNGSWVEALGMLRARADEWSRLLCVEGGSGLDLPQWVKLARMKQIRLLTGYINGSYKYNPLEPLLEDADELQTDSEDEDWETEDGEDQDGGWGCISMFC